ncbi:MAG: TIGR01777 family protein [Flavobacteriaceae bacterium]|nr:TIGR01777 family protein [Flavobacteriaceae bacterium]
MVTILITGGTGLVGQLLQRKLTNKGYIVRILTRTPKLSNEFAWDIKNNFIDKKAFENLDYIIHLVGAGIADKRWTEARKKEIIYSRTASASMLFKKIQQLNINLKGFIAASAIGYYGAVTTTHIFTEKDNPANDFLGNVCQLWETASLEFQKQNIPVTIFRLGIVLSSNGGALSKMNTPFFIAPIASGKQYIPWIHIEDVTNLFIHAIENHVTGIYNAVAPNNQTNYSFSKLLAKVNNKVFLPIGVPAFLLQLMFGKMAIILTTGSRISSEKILQSNFQFSFVNLQNALADLIKK